MSRFSFTGMLVQGDVHKPGQQRKDTKTGALKFRKDGQPDCPFYAAIAIPKNPADRFVISGTLDYDSQRALIDADARASWPQFFGGQRPQGLNFDASLPHDCTNPKFANKVLDGDGFDEKGQPNNVKDGWAGCWIFKFSNGYAPSVYEWMTDWTDPRGARQSNLWVDTNLTKRIITPGNIITVSGNCESNKSDQSPGMYMNMDTVSFEADGRPIVVASSVDPNAALGTRSGGAPNGAGAGSTGGPAHTPQTSGIAPGYDGYRQTTGGAGAPPPPGGAGAPPPPAGPQMTAAATNTYAEYLASGWTDAQLRSAGLMV